ncbi:MAG: DUF4038 domain-containing protein [Acidimicrobiia bacterium]
MSCEVQFTPESGTPNARVVRAFYDGSLTWRARLYVSETGWWRWTARCPDLTAIDPSEGRFRAISSTLRGMLRSHPQNSRQWATDDGRSFLSVGDTAYRLFAPTERAWKEYLRDDRELGITLVRAGAFGGWEWDLNRQGWWALVRRVDRRAYSNTPWSDAAATEFDLAAFRTTEERLAWMLDNCPELYVELIIFGLKSWAHDDTGSVWQAISEQTRRKTMEYIIARFAAFPQILWQVVNDIHIDPDFPNNRAFVREVGRYFTAHDPWAHLLTIGPNREGIAPFIDPETDWADFVHLQGSYELGADRIHEYDDEPKHVMLAEDRYEQDGFRTEPLHPDYFYRWLFWSWLLSGGSATYGSRFNVLHPYSQTAGLPFTNFYDKSHRYNTRLEGLDSTRWIGKYFSDRRIELWQFVSDDSLASDLDGRVGRRRPKLARRGYEEFLVYHPNAFVADRNARPAEITARLSVNLERALGEFQLEWFRPSDGKALLGPRLTAGRHITLVSPWRGLDVLARLHRPNTSVDRTPARDKSHREVKSLRQSL